MKIGFSRLIDEAIDKVNKEAVDLTDIDQLRQVFRNQTISNRTNRKRRTSEETVALNKARKEKDKERKQRAGARYS